MQFELVRDPSGDPRAIRVRWDPPDLGGLVGRIRLWPKGSWSAVGGIARRLRRLASHVPHFRVVRDDLGRAVGIAIRVDDVATAADLATEGWLVRARRTASRWMTSAAAAVPRVGVDRAEDGWPDAIQIRVGIPTDAEAAAISDERRTREWVLEPAATDLRARARELWRYRGILRYSAARSLRRQVKGMNTGLLWLFVRPLMPIIISTLIFGSLLDVPSDNVPYFLFFLAGTTAWMLFERSLMWVTRSLEMNRGLIKKVYFPRLLVPVASVTPAIIDAVVYSCLLVASAAYYLFHDGRLYLRFGPPVLMACLAAVLCILFAIAIGLWTCVWQTRFRELRYTMRYFIRFWHYLTPVLYPLSQVPAKYRWLVFINPLAALVETFKWGILGVGELPVRALGASMVIIAGSLASGVWYFSAVEGTSVDQM